MEELLITLRALRRQFVFWSRPKAWPKMTVQESQSEVRRLGHLCRRVRDYDYHLWTVTFKDGHKELAYLSYSRGMVWRRLILPFPFRPYGVESIEVF